MEISNYVALQSRISYDLSKKIEISDSCCDSSLRPDCQMQLPSVPVFVLFCKSIQDQNIIATVYLIFISLFSRPQHCVADSPVVHQ